MTYEILVTDYNTIERPRTVRNLKIATVYRYLKELRYEAISKIGGNLELQLIQICTVSKAITHDGYVQLLAITHNNTIIWDVKIKSL